MIRGLKPIILSVGGLCGSGGLVGLLHATPTILWKNGVTCRQVGVTTDEFPAKQAGVWRNWGEGEGWKNLREIPSLGVEGYEHVCYKK